MQMQSTLTWENKIDGEREEQISRQGDIRGALGERKRTFF